MPSTGKSVNKSILQAIDQAFVIWECTDIPNISGGYWIEYWHGELILLFIPCLDKERLQFTFHVGDINFREKGRKLETKKCGWRVACEEDVEALRRTGSEGSSSSDDPESYHSVNEDDVDIQSPLPKRQQLGFKSYK